MNARALIEIAQPDPARIRLRLERLVHDTAWLRGVDRPGITMDLPSFWDQGEDRQFNVVEATELWWAPAERELVGRTEDRALYLKLESDGAVAEQYVFRIKSAGTGLTEV